MLLIDMPSAVQGSNTQQAASSSDRQAASSSDRQAASSSDRRSTLLPKGAGCWWGGPLRDSMPPGSMRDSAATVLTVQPGL